MVITYQSSEAVLIKAKNETLVVGDGVRIGDRQIKGAGEYDIAAIQCEARHLQKATVYFLRAEDLTVTFLDDVDTDITKDDDASKTDILIVDVRSDADTDKLKTIIKAVEPFYVFLIGSGSGTSVNQLLSLPLAEQSTLKVTRNSLPLEGTLLIPSA